MMLAGEIHCMMLGDTLHDALQGDTHDADGAGRYTV